MAAVVLGSVPETQRLMKTLTQRLKLSFLAVTLNATPVRGTYVKKLTIYSEWLAVWLSGYKNLSSTKHAAEITDPPHQ